MRRGGGRRTLTQDSERWRNVAFAQKARHGRPGPFADHCDTASRSLPPNKAAQALQMPLQRSLRSPLARSQTRNSRSTRAVTTAVTAVVSSKPAATACVSAWAAPACVTKRRAATLPKTQAFPTVLKRPTVAPGLSDRLCVVRWPLRGRQPGVASKQYASALRGFWGWSGPLERVV